MCEQTHRQTMLNAMTKVAWKMFAMPSAKHRNMHSTPVLVTGSVYWVEQEASAEAT
jgi:hypothetical protein